MTVIDAGPLVACFDPADPDHFACHSVLQELRGTLYTTEAVLTEAFHLLIPGSRGSEGLMRFVTEAFVEVLPLGEKGIAAAFELMQQYADRPMDYADASLVVIAERLRCLKVFTLDRDDFSTYRIRKGHRLYRPTILGP